MLRNVSILVVSAALMCQSALGWQEPPKPQPAPHAQGDPVLKMSADEWKFGEVWYGEMPTYDLTLTNTGDKPINITRVRGSCSCTVPALKKNVLEPGESTTVKVTFNSMKKQGVVTSTVTVESDDPIRPVQTFRLSGTVKRVIEMSPISGLRFLETKQDVTLSGDITLTNMYTGEFKPEVQSTGSEFFKAEVKEVKPNKEYQVHVESVGELPWGPTRAIITLDTGMERMPKVQIPVTANIRARVSIAPAVVYVPKTQKTPSKRNVRVMYYGKEDFEVTGAESNTESAVVEVKPKSQLRTLPGVAAVSASIQVPIVIHVPAGNEIPDDGIEIAVHTTDPEFKDLQVLVTADPIKFRESLGIRTTMPQATPAPAAAGAAATRIQPKRPQVREVDPEALERLRRLRDALNKQNKGGGETKEEAGSGGEKKKDDGSGDGGK
jgi:hypothetical protein